MPNRVSIFFLVCFSWTLAAHAGDFEPPKTHPDTASWQNLFAPDLSDAIYPQGIWTFENGQLTAGEDQIIWTKDRYEDCIIDLEFKNGPAANSGVFLHAGKIQGDEWLKNSVEVQILDDYDSKWQQKPATWHCGGIFGRFAPAKTAVKPNGQWNRMTITCKGPMIYVLLNGEQTAVVDMKKWTRGDKNPDGSETPQWIGVPMADLPLLGHIGLQGKHGGAPIYFRNLKIKELLP